MGGEEWSGGRSDRVEVVGTWSPGIVIIVISKETRRGILNKIGNFQIYNAGVETYSYFWSRLSF